VLSVRVTYGGPAALASALVTLLTSAGLVVSWDPVQEQYTVPDGDAILVQMLVSTASGGFLVERTVKAAVENFLDRFPGVGVTIDPTAA
jgi:hypothetical protein